MSDNNDEEQNATRDFTEVTHESYFEKLKNSCGGMCIGFLLFFGSIALLVYNEGRTVKRKIDLDEGREEYVELDLSSFQSFAGQLVHTSGRPTTPDTVLDPVFGVPGVTQGNNNTSELLKLRRNIDGMYQWIETSRSEKKKTATGGTTTTTTYSYRMDWSASEIDSTRFKEQIAGRNNPSFPFSSFSDVAQPIYLGSLELGDAVVDQFNWYEPILPSLDDVPDSELRNKLEVEPRNSGFYYHRNSNSNTTTTTSTSSPQIGDTRLSFSVVRADSVSIIGEVSMSTNTAYVLKEHTTSSGRSLLLVDRGILTAEEQFDKAEAENTTLAWILRAVGFVLMVVSITLMLQPLSTAVDIIPFVGDCLQGGMEGCLFPLIGLLISIPTAGCVIALAWMAYRPLIAVPVVVATLALVVCFCLRARKLQQQNGNNNNNTNNQGGGSGTGKPPTVYSANPGTSANYGGGAATYAHTGQEPYTANAQPYQPNASAPPLYHPGTTTSAPYVPSASAPPSSSYIPEPDVQVGVPYVPQQQQQQPYNPNRMQQQQQQAAAPGGGFASALDR